MFDVICVGSATQDVFVSSDQTRLITIRDPESEQTYLSYEYGAKLAVDELFISTGGGASNTAISFGRMGLSAAVICEVGDDDAGRMIERVLSHEGLRTDMMTRNPSLKTGYSVILTGPTGDRTVLVHRGAACDLTKPEVDWDTVRQTQWLYLSSLGGDSACLWSDFTAFACDHNLKLAINPGSHQIKQGLNALRPILSVTEVLFLNNREACQLTGIEARRGDEDEREALRMLVDAGCKAVVMTMGAEGAMAYHGSEFHVVPAPRVPVVSNLGAGDAFASGCVSALHHGLSLREALKVGTLNSGSVVGCMNATDGLLRWDKVASELGR
jgi:sugar/nucleoside kinase (ribokinase family)